MFFQSVLALTKVTIQATVAAKDADALGDSKSGHSFVRADPLAPIGSARLKSELFTSRLSSFFVSDLRALNCKFLRRL